jgi:hypothetical protein
MLTQSYFFVSCFSFWIAMGTQVSSLGYAYCINNKQWEYEIYFVLPEFSVSQTFSSTENFA